MDPVDNGSELFTHQESGYDVTEVDAYIEKMNTEYQFLEKQYTRLVTHINSMARQRTITAESTTRLIADAKMKASQIIAEAKYEADHVLNSACHEIWQIQNEKRRISNELYEMANWLMTTAQQ